MSDPYELTRGICPKCMASMRVEILQSVEHNWREDGVSGRLRFLILRCGGCDTIYFGKGSVFSEDNFEEYYDEDSGSWSRYIPEDLTFYPRTQRRRKPDWYEWQFKIEHGNLSRVLGEVYASLDNDLATLSAMGLRIAFDQVAIILGVNTELTFESKIEKLLKDHHITGRERDMVRILVDAGGAAAHRGWEPSPSELTTLTEILEGLIFRSLILPERAKKLKASIPSRKPDDDIPF